MDPDELLARSADELLARYAVDTLLKQYAAGEREFGGADLREANLSNANLSDVDLGDTNLSNAKLYGVNLSHANLSHADLSQSKLYGVQLYGVNLNNADLQGAELHDVNLSYANLSDADLSEAHLMEVELGGADLSCADLSQTNLRGANLSEADLSCTNFRNANLQGANLTSITQGYNEATLETERISIDLRGANLKCAALTNADLSNADLRNANLENAILVGTNLTNASLDGANIQGTILAHLPKTQNGQNHTDVLENTPIQNRALIERIATLQAELKRRESLENGKKSHLQINGGQPKLEEEILVWEQLRFRSPAEVRIAKALDGANLLFFSNYVARLERGGVRQNEVEPGFLVFCRGSRIPTMVRWGILAVEHPSYENVEATLEEQEQEIDFERGGVRIYRFPYLKCLKAPDEVVREFIELLKLQR